MVIDSDVRATAAYVVIVLGRQGQSPAVSWNAEADPQRKPRMRVCDGKVIALTVQMPDITAPAQLNISAASPTIPRFTTYGTEPLPSSLVSTAGLAHFGGFFTPTGAKSLPPGESTNERRKTKRLHHRACRYALRTHIKWRELAHDLP